jgi:hypothetical protein
MDYKIYYGVLPSKRISDRVLVKNPHYGQRIGEWGSRAVKPIKYLYDKLEAESGFYTKLEESILKEGIRNPLFCNAIEEGTFCRVGTSRLWIAQKHSLDVAVIIVDYVGAYADSGLEELKTEKDIRDKFKEQPDVVDFNCESKVGNVWIGGLPHYHLGETDDND